MADLEARFLLETRMHQSCPEIEQHGIAWAIVGQPQRFASCRASGVFLRTRRWLADVERFAHRKTLIANSEYRSQVQRFVSVDARDLRDGVVTFGDASPNHGRYSPCGPPLRHCSWTQSDRRNSGTTSSARNDPVGFNLEGLASLHRQDAHARRQRPPPPECVSPPALGLPAQEIRRPRHFKLGYLDAQTASPVSQVQRKHISLRNNKAADNGPTASADRNRRGLPGLDLDRGRAHRRGGRDVRTLAYDCRRPALVTGMTARRMTNRPSASVSVLYS